MRRSGARDLAKILKREFGREVAAAVSAVRSVAPRAQQPRSRGVQEDDERVGRVFDDETVVAPPVRGDARRLERGAEQPAEAAVDGVEKPGGVARIDDDEPFGVTRREVEFDD